MMITQETNTSPVTDELQVDNANVIGSRLARMDPAIFSDQSGAAIDDGAESEPAPDDEEPTDEEGDPTGEHDHHQDDNYALGGHVTRSGSV
ncbi:hypothetical protein [Spirosoma rigui]|uniref:hypothetical protein n=1 Tax=Spirosoma rigui TaxID=564064 RepID=UPI0009B0E3A9|nr:hypothetical protein [Spirosoma rigui]